MSGSALLSHAHTLNTPRDVWRCLKVQNTCLGQRFYLTHIHWTRLEMSEGVLRYRTHVWVSAFISRTYTENDLRCLKVSSGVWQSFSVYVREMKALTQTCIPYLKTWGVWRCLKVSEGTGHMFVENIFVWRIYLCREDILVENTYVYGTHMCREFSTQINKLSLFFFFIYGEKTYL